MFGNLKDYMWWNKKKNLQNIYQDLGYVADQEGIIQRFLREDDAWQEHVHNCKQVIIDACSKQKATSVAILGSGWLLDVPIDFFCENNIELYLIDIVHPKQITHKFRKSNNIHFIEQDITGGAAAYIHSLLSKKHTSSSDILDFSFNKYELPYPVDLVISLNILNQLDILLIDAFSAKVELELAHEIAFRKQIQQNHISMLTKHAYCLISDWEKHTRNLLTSQMQTEQLIYAQPPHENFYKEWVWQFDTNGTYEPNATTKFVVRAYTNAIL